MHIYSVKCYEWTNGQTNKRTDKWTPTIIYIDGHHYIHEKLQIYVYGHHYIHEIM